MEDSGKNTLSDYNERISLDDGVYYVQGLYNESKEESEFIQMTRPIEALLEPEKENIENVNL